MLRLQNAQTSMDYVDKLYPNNKSNDRSAGVKINGPVDETVLAQAFNMLVERHELLRSFKDKNFNMSVLSVIDYADVKKLPFNTIDATSIHPAPRIEDTVRTLQQLHEEKFIEERFPLDTGPLWRAALIKFADNQYHLVFLFNHIIVDEVSIGIILKDLSAFYNAIINKTAPDLKTIPSLTQIEPMDDEEKRKRLGYWKEQLKDLNQAHLMPDFNPQKKFPFPGKRISFNVDAKLLEQVKARNPGYSDNVIQLTCFFILLRLLTNEKDICAGITSSNRRNEKIGDENMKNLVNAFFNSIPMRVRFEDDEKKAPLTIAQLLKNIKALQSQALKNQLPLDVIMNDAVDRHTKSALSFASPFNMLFVLNEKKPTLTFAGTKADYPVELDLGQCKMPDFGVNIDELYDGSFRFTLEFNTDRYSENTIRTFHERYLKVLSAMADNPEKLITDISVVLPQELDLVDQFNQTDNNSRRPVHIHEYLHLIALASPNLTAIQFHREDNTTENITYGELDRQSTQLANYLKQHGVGPDMPVGVCLPRSIKLYICLFAVLKAGGILVPLDQDEKIAAFKIEDAKIKTILGGLEGTAKFADKDKTLINVMDNDTWNQIGKSDARFIPFEHKANNPAYLMYTSGTTGPKPKGVICSHDGMSNLLEELIAQAAKSPAPNLKILSTAPATFDAFIYDIIKMLAHAGELHLSSDRDRLSPRVIEDLVRRYNIEFAVFLPMLMKELDPRIPLKHIISMGEAPQAEVIREWLKAYPGRRIENGYGPTESGICVSTQPLGLETNPNLIGKPINNMHMLILNPENHALCPIGVPGEIFISGPGVACGYLNNAVNDAEKFIWMGGVRNLATGDYAMWQPQNNGVGIEFIGRRDRQVKINGGVRVDLNAVEKTLSSLPFIKDIVLLPNPENTGLIAYLVPQHTSMSNFEMRNEIRKLLSSNTLLPAVVYPKAVISVSELPKTANGKIDIRSLPVIAANDVATGVVTRNPLQKRLIQIWSKILGEPEDQIDTNWTFKELGGNSLDRAGLEIRLNYEFNLSDIGPNILTEDMTIESLAQLLAPRLANHNVIIVPPNIFYNDNNMFIFRTRSSDQNLVRSTEKDQVKNNGP